MDVANGGGLQLTNFAISHVDHIDIDVSDLGPLDWILELLVDFVDTFLKVPGAQYTLLVNLATVGSCGQQLYRKWAGGPSTQLCVRIESVGRVGNTCPAPG